MKKKLTSKRGPVIFTVLAPSTNAAIDGVVVTPTVATIAANAVTSNGDSGRILTGALTTAAVTWETPVTFTNNKITATSKIFVSVSDMTGSPATAGVPSVLVSAKAAGSCTLEIGNTDPTNALTGAFEISYLVINSVA